MLTRKGLGELFRFVTGILLGRCGAGESNISRVLHPYALLCNFDNFVFTFIALLQFLCTQRYLKSFEHITYQVHFNLFITQFVKTVLDMARIIHILSEFMFVLSMWHDC